ncbi:MAG: hypothetical protein K0S55_429 [Clostridia bacterium]|nr:hypothetical protein [Clostridia bacterium]
MYSEKPVNNSNKKVYVKVTADFREDGTIIPHRLTWEDGKTYEIDKVLEVKSAASQKVGGQGDRFKIQVLGKESYLFFERNGSVTGNNIGRWFVERK